MDEQDKIWYVIYTRPRWEKKVSRNLLQKGIENYCPLNKVRKKWSDRTKVILEPLFKGYVFVKIPEADKWNIRKIDGVINYVHWLGRPAKVKESEIDTIKKFLQEFSDVQVDSQLQVDTSVIVKQGVLMDYSGIIIEVTGSKARVKIDSMGIRLVAFFDKANLTPSGLN